MRRSVRGEVGGEGEFGLHNGKPCDLLRMLNFSTRCLKGVGQGMTKSELCRVAIGETGSRDDNCGVLEEPLVAVKIKRQWETPLGGSGDYQDRKNQNEVAEDSKAGVWETYI